MSNWGESQYIWLRGGWVWQFGFITSGLHWKLLILRIWIVPSENVLVFDAFFLTTCAAVHGQGRLKGGSLAAIKVLSPESNQGFREFLTEINVISLINHENLVKLEGCCVEGNHIILVYEFLENNSLAQSLLGKSHGPVLHAFLWVLFETSLYNTVGKHTINGLSVSTLCFHQAFHAGCPIFQFIQIVHPVEINTMDIQWNSENSKPNSCSHLIIGFQI